MPTEETPEKVEFEVDNFKGEMIFLHRPVNSMRAVVFVARVSIDRS